MCFTVWSASRTQCVSRSWLASRLWCLSGYWCLCRFGIHFIDNKLTPYGSNFLRPLNCRFVPPKVHIGHAAGEVPLRSPQVTHLIVRFGYAFVPTTNTGPFVRPRLHIRSPMLVIDFSSSLLSPFVPPRLHTHQIVHFGQGDFPLKSEPFCPKKIGPGGRRFSSRKLAPMGLFFGRKTARLSQLAFRTPQVTHLTWQSVCLRMPSLTVPRIVMIGLVPSPSLIQYATRR